MPFQQSAVRRGMRRDPTMTKVPRPAPSAASSTPRSPQPWSRPQTARGAESRAAHASHQTAAGLAALRAEKAFRSRGPLVRWSRGLALRSLAVLAAPRSTEPAVRVEQPSKSPSESTSESRLARRGRGEVAGRMQHGLLACQYRPPAPCCAGQITVCALFGRENALLTVSVRLTMPSSSSLARRSCTQSALVSSSPFL